MIEIANSSPTMTVPAEVEAFAAEKGATEYLPGVVALTQHIFPTHPLNVEVEDDPELSYNRTIVFTIAVRGWDSERYLATRWQWVDGLFECCPAPLVHVFGLNLMMVE